MARTRRHSEHHTGERMGWLRAAVLGSNDAVVSTSSLMLGVAASHASTHAILVAGMAGLVGGATSMAAGEYVSVASQRDAEEADIAKEKAELATQPEAELDELVGIYVKRGLDRELARKVAEQLSARDRLGAHLRDELGIERHRLANPIQAALASAASFAIAAALPVLALLVAPQALQRVVVGVTSLVALGVLGALGAHLGNAPKLKPALRVVVGGALAMGLSSLIGWAFGVEV